MRIRFLLVIISLALTASGPLSAYDSPHLQLMDKAQNSNVSAVTATRPVTTILISIDGFRHDYLEKYSPPQLLDIAANGLRVERFLPIYPSKTFPNHLSIITGSYSARHGLVHNEFYSKASGKLYKKGYASMDPSWLTALPLWTLAEQQGLHSAVIFWPEAEVKVGQALPQDLMPWQRGVSDQQIIDNIITTISRPTDQRPDFIASYLSSVDSAGHDFGPDSPQVAQAISELDQGIARLRDTISKLNRRVNLVIISDHGMSDISSAKPIIWPELVTSDNQIKVVNAGTQLMITARHGADASSELQRLRARLINNAKGRYRVLSDNELKRLSHVGTNVADIICEVVTPYLFSKTADLGAIRGNHGWDVAHNPEMAGFMIATGPSFRSGQQTGSVENIHLYPLLAEILGLKINHEIDGKLAVLSRYLRDNK